jgi:hypothetical protein
MSVFAEFWEGHFQCRYPNSAPTPYNRRYTHDCDITKRLHRDNTAFEGQLQFVSDAVMAFAHAFKYSSTLPFTINELYKLTAWNTVKLVDSQQENLRLLWNVEVALIIVCHWYGTLS